jgi:putative ABC transport system permease protein
VFPECALPPEQEKAWRTSRNAVIAGKRLVDRFGWKIGDPIPLLSQIWPQKGGSRAWNFELAGIFDDRAKDACPRLGNMYIRYDYFDEARQFGQGAAGIFVVRIKDPNQAEAIAQTIDAMFENSPDETKTQTEREFTLNFGRQLGNLHLIFNLILGAVFFAILLLTYNTMSQAVQDRVPELAVLKTIGYTDANVLGLVLAESLLLCVIGGLAGMLLSTQVMKLLGAGPFAFPPMSADLGVWVFAVVSMLLLGLVIGLLPAYRAWRLPIVDALAGR